MEPTMQRAKVVLLGESAVGKTSLLQQFAKGQFVDNRDPTVGPALLKKTIPNLNLKLQIWDTAGQERFHCMAHMYYRNADAAVIVYDITSQDSFFRAQFWVKEVKQQVNSNLIIVLAGNKADLEADRSVATAMAEFYADQNGLYFMETSARTAANVDDIFTTIAERLTQLPEPAPVGHSPNIIRLDSPPPPAEDKKGSENKKGCCTIM